MPAPAPAAAGGAPPTDDLFRVVFVHVHVGGVPPACLCRAYGRRVCSTRRIFYVAALSLLGSRNRIHRAVRAARTSVVLIYALFVVVSRARIAPAAARAFNKYVVVVGLSLRVAVRAPPVPCPPPRSLLVQQGIYV